MRGIKFYSEHDLSCKHHLVEIVNKIKAGELEKLWDVNDVIDFFNVKKYIQVKQFSDYINQEAGIEVDVIETQINKKIGIFMGKYKFQYLSLYDEIHISRKNDFFELFERYKVFESIEGGEFKLFLSRFNINLKTVLKFKKIVETYDSVVRDELLIQSSNAATIISLLISSDDGYLPKSLTEMDIVAIINSYIESDDANLNILRKIVNFPPMKGKGNIPDKIRLLATKKVKEQEDAFFKNGSGIKSGISIYYLDDLSEDLVFKNVDMETEIKIRKSWITDNLDNPTLWNNFIYLFGFVDNTMRIALCSMKIESSAMEFFMSDNSNHLYPISISFKYKEKLSDLELISYSEVLNVYNFRLVDMIKWFFCDYLKLEFNISNFAIKMPREETSYLEKCRAILPEMDRVLKQYNLLVEEGEIDQELIQISNSSIKYKDYKTFNDRKYVYPIGDWYRTTTFLLFSDQSSIFYLGDTEEKYENFFDLINSENLVLTDFEEYQIQEIEWLFTNDIICYDMDGFIKFKDSIMIFILRELFYKEFLNYWRYPKEIRDVIDFLHDIQVTEFGNSLFSKQEQDYLNFNMNKSDFTNGLNLRNDYLHGTNSMDEKQNKMDYYKIMKIFVLIVIKINDDLCIKEDYKANPL